jgi:hypothetical protein
MFDFLPKEKVEILKKNYPFIKAYFEKDVDINVFIDDLSEFLKTSDFTHNLKSIGFTGTELEQIRQITIQKEKTMAQETHNKAIMKSFLMILNYLPTEHDALFHFLVEHKEDLPGMFRAAGDQVRPLIECGFVSVWDLIRKYPDKWWPMIVRDLPLMAKAADDDAEVMFRFGLPAVKQLINEKTWPKIANDLSVMTKAAGDKAKELYEGLHALNDVLDETTWDDTVEIVKAIGDKAGNLFLSDLIPIRDSGLVTKKNWHWIAQIAIEAGKRSYYIFNDCLPNLKNLVNENTLPGIAELIKASRSDTAVAVVFGRCLPAVEGVVNDTDWPILVKYLSEIARREENEQYFRYLFYLQKDELKHLVESRTLLSYMKTISSDARYYSCAGLRELGFLCCHVTNAYGGGQALAPEEEKRTDPYANIINCINNQGQNRFQLSISTIHPDRKTRIARTEYYGIDGSIGVILDSGHIYESYLLDDWTRTPVKGEHSSYRTGDKNARVPAEIASLFGYPGNYNEHLVRKFTIGGLFYTKGVQDWVISKLKDIADEYSNRKYINPEYINRKIPFGVPKEIEKIFTVYEIDYDTNTWKIVYTPNKRDSIIGIKETGMRKAA